MVSSSSRTQRQAISVKMRQHAVYRKDDRRSAHRLNQNRRSFTGVTERFSTQQDVGIPGFAFTTSVKASAR